MFNADVTYKVEKISDNGNRLNVNPGDSFTGQVFGEVDGPLTVRGAMSLRTSPITSITELSTGEFLVTTKNSLYRVEPVDAGPGAA